MVVYKESHLIITWSCDNKSNMTKQQVCRVGHFENQKERGGVCAPPTKVVVMAWIVVVYSSSPPSITM